MLVILDPETPGGLRLSMDCRYASSSATADDMVVVESASPLLVDLNRVTAKYVGFGRSRIKIVHVKVSTLRSSS